MMDGAEEGQKQRVHQVLDARGEESVSPRVTREGFLERRCVLFTIQRSVEAH